MNTKTTATADLTLARDFSSRSLRAFRIASVADAPAIVSADGTVRTFVIMGVEHHQGYAHLIGWARVGKEWRDEVLETWESDISDAQAFAEAEILPRPLTIAA